MKYIHNLRGKNEQEVLNALGDAAFPLLIGGGDENEEVKVFIDDNQESLNNRINTATDIQEAFNITYKPYIINGYDQRISLRDSLGFYSKTYNAYTSGLLTNAPTCYNYSKVSPITYSSSNTDVATVDTNSGAVTVLTSGTTIIKVNFAGNEKYKPHEAQYTLTIDIPAAVDPEPNYPLHNGHKYVDLGLPSGTMWSAYNMGASAVNEIGDEYAFGNIEPEIDQYFVNYNYTKYYSGDVLELMDDAAHVNWGGNWVIPSPEDFDELFDSTYVTVTKVTNYLGRGVNGLTFTSKTNGNVLFFPFDDDGHYELHTNIINYTAYSDLVVWDEEYFNDDSYLQEATHDNDHVRGPYY